MEIDLTPKEFDLLVLLVSDAGAVLSRERIIEQVWNEHWWGSTKILQSSGGSSGQRSRHTA